MYASRTTQFIVGIFGILGIVALSVLAFELGKIPLFTPPTYTLYAMFDNVSGLNINDAVQIAGVKVGKVTAITLAQQSERARVVMQINHGVDVDDDAIASIKTSGIIGSKYIAISIGGGENLRNGGTIKKTESSFVLEDAIAQLMSSSKSPAGGGGEGAQSGPGAPAASASPSNPIANPPGLKSTKPQNKQNKK